jgi:ketosteroid isomerase-like protein
MTREEAIAYARRWTEDWNRRDLEAVLAHFEDDVVFTSPKALEVIGAPTVRGKAALREYWRAALGRIETLRFTLERVIWDAEASELSIVYDRDVNGRRDRAAEVLRFGPSGRVARGEVLYGVIP